LAKIEVCYKLEVEFVIETVEIAILSIIEVQKSSINTSFSINTT
jgi:hypothetical protein